jgi:hypothetical protein
MKLPISFCLVCYYKMNIAKMIGVNKNAKPKPSDITVCIKCGEILMLDSEMKTVQPTIARLTQLSPEGHKFLGFVQKTVRSMRLVP